MQQRIIISRTDSIGDVMLTLPMCGILKKHNPHCYIIFLGRTYTRDIIEASIYVDEFVNWDDWKEAAPQKQIEIIDGLHADVIIHVFPRKELLWVAKRARIPMRIATGRRVQTITKANKLFFFTRKNSTLHEAQLNMKLLKPLGINETPSLEEIATLYGFEKLKSLPEKISSLVDGSKINIILHPKSKGSAVDWGMEHFKELIEMLPPDKTKIFITGTSAEGELIRKEADIKKLAVQDLTGQLTLTEMISFIGACDALVAASTGPLHIAAALGKKAIGLYTPKRPMHPGRWAPVGKNAKVLVAAHHPLKGSHLDISPQDVKELLLG